jgi:tRNA pseudouridine55 synthase
VRRLLAEKRVGHCGTLDPAATGLLVLTVGRATRLTRFLIRAPKVYEGTLHLGVATDTYDAEGRVVAEAATAGLTRETIEAAMVAFEGTYRQQAPPFSAKKVKGVKFYELARRGEEVPEETKEVAVFEFRPLGDIDDDRLRFRLACSSGTYARSLVHDLGARLGCGAHLLALRRLAVGPFRVEDAVSLGALADRLAAGEGPGSAWIPFDEIPLPFSEISADSLQEQRIRQGQTVLVRELAGEEGDWVKLVNRRRQFIAVGTVVERVGGAGVGVVQPKVVFK